MLSRVACRRLATTQWAASLGSQSRAYGNYGENKKQRQLRMAREEQRLPKPYPINSTDPEIFAIQQKIFGIASPSEGRSGRKVINALPRGKMMKEWYPPQIEELKQHMMKRLKEERKELRNNNGDEEELMMIQEELEAFRWTEDQERRQKKLKQLKRRGKAPPKKGEGKRAKKK